ncbi:MFS transporter [Kitasatospora sp. MAA4]|uniref:CynX/NimT family MFS transporter n=1 Tax=Kitasatospora sp. MAA4 TaxID=3035093 RepID=UPI0024754888|nr:MFS transporter [Kitasatospora sp. MAA4]
MLLAINLRAAITCVAPVLDNLRVTFGLSGVQVSILTALPVLCLGAFASLAPPLARRVGTEGAVTLSLLLITAGILLRVLPSPITLFTGTVVAGGGIAMGNVLLPVEIKRRFARRVGSLTGLAMMLMAATGALAAALTVPLDHSAGWRVALAVWAVPSLAATLLWGPRALRGRHERGHPVPADRRLAGEPSLLRSPLAWALAAFLGLASLMFYVLTAWLPASMQDHGFAQAEAGMMVSAMMIVGIPMGFVVPVLAVRLNDQRPMILAVAVIMAVGLTGLLLAPRSGWVWVPVLGLATGSAFPLAVTMLSLRSPNPQVAARLSGMAQSVGYLLAGFGPVSFGLLHTLTGGWQVPLLLLLVLVVPETFFGLLAARPGFVLPDTVRLTASAGLLVELNIPA